MPYLSAGIMISIIMLTTFPVVSVKQPPTTDNPNGNNHKVSSSSSASPSVAMVRIPAGEFLMGSTPSEREVGYRLDEARGSTSARDYNWFENEDRHKKFLGSYTIDGNLVTNAKYKRFIDSQDYKAPYVDKKTWNSYGLVHPYKTVKRFLWVGNSYPLGRDQHPVVLISHDDATAYCRWRGQQEQRHLRLPTEAEWEKAARGETGNIFPWGNKFDRHRLNSIDAGPYDTMPVQSFPDGVSPYGVLNMAGMVFEWTSSSCPSNPGQFFVKGGSWDDYPGVTRSAARHCRPESLKHVLVGFRCTADI